MTASLELDPSQPVSKLCNRADVFRDLERFEEAVADLDRVVALAPDDAAAKAQLAEVRTAMAVPVSARNAFKAARAKYNADKWQVRLKKRNKLFVSENQKSVKIFSDCRMQSMASQSRLVVVWASLRPTQLG